MQSGQPLTEEEKAEYEQLGLDIQSLGEKFLHCKQNLLKKLKK